MRHRAAAVAVPAALLALAACGGDERQDAGAPAGEFGLDVTRASFPPRQALAQPAVLQLVVRNTGERAVPELAVTVETVPPRPGLAPGAFATAVGGAGLADRSRPVWVLDRGPAGGRTAYVNTWALGPLERGVTRRVDFIVTAVRAGRHRVRWRVSPALVGDARAAAGGRTRGVFRVTVSDAPVDAAVGPDAAPLR